MTAMADREGVSKGLFRRVSAVSALTVTGNGAGKDPVCNRKRVLYRDKNSGQ